MAAKESIPEQKRRLVLSLDASRRALRHSGHDLRLRLHPGRALRQSFHRHPLRLFAATALGVALLTLRLKRRRRGADSPKSSKSLLAHFRGLLFLLAKPALALWFRNLLKSHPQWLSGDSIKDSLLGP